MDCSIIIPNYNYSQYLGEAIESALGQTLKCEIIVVDDCSTDDSIKVALKYPVNIIQRTENKGLGAARNLGIKAAKGNWILPLDSDDLIHPRFIEKTLGQGDVVGTGLEEFENSNKKYLPPSNLKWQDFLEHNRLYGTTLFRKSLWEKVGGYREGLAGYEDWDFWLRLAYAGAEINIVREYLFFYRKHGKSMITDVKANHEKHFEILKKNNPSIYGGL